MSDEADRRRAYRELEERGQPVPGKYFGTRMPPMKQKETPKIKVIDTTKMKQLKLLRKGGEADALQGIAKMITDIEKGKTGIKTVDMQKRKDAAITKNLKKMAKTSRVKSKPQTFDITPKPGSALSIQKRTITMAKDGGLMEAIEKVKAKGMEEGGDVPKPKMRPKKDPFRADKTVILNEEFSKKVAKANEEAMKKAKKMEAGGEVPAKFKGFSKLPEAVQEKMDPGLAKKFGMGGSVKGKGSKMMCRGRGAAVKGGGFSIR